MKLVKLTGVLGLGVVVGRLVVVSAFCSVMQQVPSSGHVASSSTWSQSSAKSPPMQSPRHLRPGFCRGGGVTVSWNDHVR